MYIFDSILCFPNRVNQPKGDKFIYKRVLQFFQISHTIYTFTNSHFRHAEEPIVLFGTSPN